jgi:hypothetical protein
MSSFCLAIEVFLAVQISQVSTMFTGEVIAKANKSKRERGKGKSSFCDLPRAADSGQSIRSDDPIRLGRADFCDVVQVVQNSNVVQGRS